MSVRRSRVSVAGIRDNDVAALRYHGWVAVTLMAAGIMMLFKS